MSRSAIKATAATAHTQIDGFRTRTELGCSAKSPDVALSRFASAVALLFSFSDDTCQVSHDDHLRTPTSFL